MRRWTLFTRSATIIVLCISVNDVVIATHLIVSHEIPSIKRRRSNKLETGVRRALAAAAPVRADPGARPYTAPRFTT